ncbi:FliH/SctL family protein [Candidatus Nitronereus thalassa]|uniref:Flagellar assembly protein FliH n=1 Tax=Candidatus Nitronereus thalassa TaxID=3020898 RepID=A0ABU3K6E9_9BACT|nr:FliH/SctL family protein [Candidatus Nitronereus thalassa]MDT7041918.1 FliH/SctL family protein [Candidatus Nitronereus thalassa]
MPSRWSKVIKEVKGSLAIESWEALDLDEERLARERAEQEKEPPHDCSQLQQEAYESGVEAGRTQGRAEVQGPAEAEMARALSLISQVEHLRVQSAKQAEADIVELALAMARKVIHRETSLDPDILVTQVREIISSIAEKGLIRVLVHPNEVEHLLSFRDSLPGADGKPAQLSIEADETIQAGGCIIESSQYFINATIETQLEAIWQEMLVSDAENDSPSTT